MAFNKDNAFEMAQKAALARKAKAAQEGNKTLNQQIKEVRREQESLKRSAAERFYIHTPLADAAPELKSGAVKLEIQIPAGPTAHKDEEGKVRYRERGVLVLLEGEGVTTDPLWAEWIENEFGREGWTVSRIQPAGLSSYMQEIEEAKRALELQEV